MTRIAIMALEGIEEHIEDEVLPNQEIEKELDSQDAQVELVENDQDAIIEGETTVDTLTSVAQAPTPEEGVLIATEHLFTRLYGKANKLSMESFTANKDKFNVAFESNLSIAQEGLMARLANTVKLVFASKEKIATIADAGLQKIKDNGSKTSVIEEPGWGRSFSTIGKSRLNASDVMKTMHSYEKLLTSSEMTSAVESYISICEDIAASVSKSRFIAKNTAVKEIEDLNSKCGDLLNNSEKIIVANQANAKNDPSFEPIGEKDAEKLNDSIVNILSNQKNQALFRRLDRAIDDVNVKLWYEANIRIMKWGAADLRAARAIIMRINPALIDIISVIRKRDRLAYACAQYIRASAA